MKTDALFSEDRRFRYWLLREWDSLLPKVCFIGLNPSVADESLDDPTIRRCIGFARSWKCGSLLMLNIYAYRATLPDDMWKAQTRGVDIIGGKQNWIDSLKEYVQVFHCIQVVAAWGRHGKKRGPEVMMKWPELLCLARNSDGSPKHPLYLKANLKPELLRRPV